VEPSKPCKENHRPCEDNCGGERKVIDHARTIMVQERNFMVHARISIHHAKKAMIMQKEGMAHARTIMPMQRKVIVEISRSMVSSNI